MNTTNDLQKLLLSALSESHGTGYDLSLMIRKSGIWDASHQQIYRELNRLHNDGLLVVKEVPQVGKPDKRIYSLTERGELALLNTAKLTSFKPRVLRHVSAIMLQIGAIGYFEKMVEVLTDRINELNNQMALESTSEMAALVIARDIGVLNTDLSFAHSALNLIAKQLNEVKES